MEGFIMKAYQHLSFRLEIGNKKDAEIKSKLQKLKAVSKKSYNLLLKEGVETLYQSHPISFNEA